MVVEPSALSALLCVLAVGVRSGAGGPWRALGVAVRVTEGGSKLERVIEVELWKPLECFVAPPGTRVFIDDENLTLVTAGRVLAPETQALQLRLPVPRCEPALFRSRPFIAGPPTVNKVRVEIGRRKGQFEIEGLRTDRSFELVTPGKLTPGRDVVLEWRPRTDVWPDKSLDAEVRLEGDDGTNINVAAPNLHMKDGRFQFVMPQMRPGGVTINVRPGSPGPHARTVLCHGFAECRSFEPGGALPLRGEIAAPNTAKP